MIRLWANLEPCVQTNKREVLCNPARSDRAAKRPTSLASPLPGRGAQPDQEALRARQPLACGCSPLGRVTRNEAVGRHLRSTATPIRSTSVASP